MSEPSLTAVAEDTCILTDVGIYLLQNKYGQKPDKQTKKV
jgi:hypothetical protein